MAISDTIKTIVPYIKEAGNYVRLMITSDSVKMNDGSSLESTIANLKNNSGSLKFNTIWRGDVTNGDTFILQDDFTNYQILVFQFSIGSLYREVMATSIGLFRTAPDRLGFFFLDKQNDVSFGKKSSRAILFYATPNVHLRSIMAF